MRSIYPEYRGHGFGPIYKSSPEEDPPDDWENPEETEVDNIIERDVYERLN